MGAAGYGMVQQGIFRAPYALQRGFYGGGGNQDPLAALIGNALGTYQASTEKDKADALQAKQEQDVANWRNFTGKLAAYKEGLTTEAPTPDNTPTGFTPPAAGGIQPPELATANQRPAPLLTDPTGQPWWKSLQQPATKFTPVAEGAGAFDPTKGTTTPTGFTPPPKPGSNAEQFQIHVNDDGSVSWIPKAPPGSPGAPGQQPPGNGIRGAPVTAKITPKQRESAGNGVAAQSADQDLRQIENTNRPALGEVARWIATPSIGRLVPGIGVGIQDILRQARSAGLSDPAQTYLKRMFDFASLAGPARYGRRFGSEIALQQIWSDFGAGQLGVGAGGIGATQKNRENAVRAIRTAAGESAWKEAQGVPTDRAAPSGPANQRSGYRPDNPFAPRP